ncbi:hypothetical protein IE81DRAFT_174389 [Ceraceosorus guamensis]|uniref:Uncharacterized protein n=1 Tax=Ceraceosorus guamensis TaxID=1522189 RepID=A0A316VYN0_9BASI|nr:hypothetical protein IE81DRAFT_174389 [Ceraceosorus guamensis]PWN41503.1 hypothetical protein IE81DRAFT_174389 [Ceraceosorus guamensis]
MEDGCCTQDVDSCPFSDRRPQMLLVHLVEYQSRVAFRALQLDHEQPYAPGLTGRRVTSCKSPAKSMAKPNALLTVVQDSRSAVHAPITSSDVQCRIQHPNTKGIGRCSSVATLHRVMVSAADVCCMESARAVLSAFSAARGRACCCSQHFSSSSSSIIIISSSRWLQAHAHHHQHPRSLRKSPSR